MDKQERIGVKHIIARKHVVPRSPKLYFSWDSCDNPIRAKQTVLLGNVNKRVMCDIQNMKNITQYLIFIDNRSTSILELSLLKQKRELVNL